MLFPLEKAIGQRAMDMDLTGLWDRAADIISAVKDHWGLAALIIVALVAIVLRLFPGEGAWTKLGALLVVACVGVALLFLLVPGVAPPPAPADPWARAGNVGCVVVVGLDEQKGDGFLAVRSSPAVGSDLLDKVYNGETLFVHERDSNWLQIRLLRGSDKIEGWVFRGYTNGATC
jgi:hypothetical protein